MIEKPKILKIGIAGDIIYENARKINKDQSLLNVSMSNPFSNT